VDRFRLRVRNQSNRGTWETKGRDLNLAEGLRLEYATGVNAAARFHVEPTTGGSRLWIVEDYDRLPEAERRARLAEVERSLPR